MIHYMKLQDKPFEAIDMGEKTIELRLNDEKRQQIRIGDQIVFTLAGKENMEIKTYVIALHSADSFVKLFEEVSLADCGFSEEADVNAAVESMRQYYSAEEENQYGVLGIELSWQDPIKKAKMDSLVDFLQNEITDNMPIEDIVNVFEQMSAEPVQGTMLLFETGTFSFSGRPLFEICLVRQVPNDDYEFYQIHVVLYYEPDEENEKFSEAVWDVSLKENFFEFIRKSEAYVYAQKNNYIKVKIYMDET